MTTATLRGILSMSLSNTPSSNASQHSIKAFPMASLTFSAPLEILGRLGELCASNHSLLPRYAQWVQVKRASRPFHDRILLFPDPISDNCYEPSWPWPRPRTLEPLNLISTEDTPVVELRLSIMLSLTIGDVLSAFSLLVIDTIFGTTCWTGAR